MHAVRMVGLREHLTGLHDVAHGSIGSNFVLNEDWPTGHPSTVERIGSKPCPQNKAMVCWITRSHSESEWT